VLYHFDLNDYSERSSGISLDDLKTAPFASNRFVSFVFSRFPKDADGLIRFPDFVAGLAPFIVENPTEERLRGALMGVRNACVDLTGSFCMV